MSLSTHKLHWSPLGTHYVSFYLETDDYEIMVKPDHSLRITDKASGKLVCADKNQNADDAKLRAAEWLAEHVER